MIQWEIWQDYVTAITSHWRARIKLWMLSGKLRWVITGRDLLFIICCRANAAVCHGKYYVWSLEQRSCSQESQNVKSSHDKQETRITEDKQAVRTSHWNEHGSLNALFCSDVVGTDSMVLILDRCDWDKGDCQDGGFLSFLIFLSLSCLAVSASREDSTDVLWRKEREAPTTGSG